MKAGSQSRREVPSVRAGWPVLQQQKQNYRSLRAEGAKPKHEREINVRVLQVSDIHANLQVLEAVLAAAHQYDTVWNLGDVLGYGANPNEVMWLRVDQTNNSKPLLPKSNGGCHVRTHCQPKKGDQK